MTRFITQRSSDNSERPRRQRQFVAYTYDLQDEMRASMSFLLAHLLTQDKLITYDEMVTIFSRRQKRQEQPTTLDAELCKNGHLTPLQANTYLARAFDVPPIDLKALQQVDGSVILQVTPSIAKTYKVFPYLSDGATLQLATTIDFDPENQEEIEKKLGLKVQCTPISQIFMAQLLELHYAVIPSKTLRPLLDKWPLDKQVPTTETPQAKAPKAPKDPLAGLLDGIAGLDAFGDLDLSSDLQNLSKQNLTAVETDIPKDIDASSDALPAVTEEVTSTPAPVETSTAPAPVEEPEKNNIALSMDDLEYLFEHTQTRTGMIEVGMRFCEKFVDQAGFLLVPKDKVVGYRLPGAPDLEKAFKSIEISLDSDSIFNRLRESYVPYAGPPPESEADRFMFMLFYPPPEVIYLFAIRLKGRPVAVLYGHRNNGLLSEDEFSEFTRCAELMELTLEQILLKFKQGIKDESQTVKHALKAIQLGNREALASIIPSFQAIEEVEAEAAPTETEPEAAPDTATAASEPEEDDDLLIEEPDFLPSQASLDAVPAHTVDLPGPSSTPVAVETPTSTDESPTEQETTSEEEPPEVDTTTDEPAPVTAESDETEQQTPEADAPEASTADEVTSASESNAEETVAEETSEETVAEETVAEETATEETPEETVTEESTSEEATTSEESTEEEPVPDDVPETTPEEATAEASPEVAPEESAETAQDEESAKDSSQATDSVEEAPTEASDDATPTAEESAATEDKTTETDEASTETSEAPVEAGEAPAETGEQPADTTSTEEASDEAEQTTDKNQRPSKDEPPSKNRPPQEDISVFSNIYQTHEAATSVSSDSLDIKEKKDE